MRYWLILLAGGLITYTTRLSFILLFGRQAFPRWLERSLRYVPPAVLAAILCPELLVRAGQIDFSPTNSRLIAGLVAILVAWRTRNTLLTIAAGMATLWLLLFVL